MSGATVPPSSIESGTGWYVYGVVPADVSGDVLADIRGVDPSADIVLIPDGGLAAVASSVSLEEFGQAALEKNLHDEAWLEDKVRAHEAVLEAALPETSLVPFRFGTIYRSDEQIRNMLRENRHLADTLERLRGTVELGVKAFLDPAEFDRRHGGDTRAEAGEAGRAYLLRQQRDRRLGEERAAFAAACAQASHERFSVAAVDGRTNPLQRPEVTGRSGEMFLNGAYLVLVEREDAFREALAELEWRYEAEGVRYELTGPWPAYNFAELEASP